MIRSTSSSSLSNMRRGSFTSSRPSTLPRQTSFPKGNLVNKNGEGEGGGSQGGGQGDVRGTGSSD